MDQKKTLIMIVLIVFLAGLVSAEVSCTPSLVSKTYDRGSSPPDSEIACTNIDTNFTVTLTSVGDYFSIDESTIGIAPSSKTITLSFDGDAPQGNHFGTIEFDDGSNPIAVFLTVNDDAPEQTYSIIVFPTSKIVSVRQGETKSQNIQLIVPSDYPESISVQSVSFNPDIDVVRFGDLDLGLLNPGQTLNIPIEIDAREALTGTYTTTVSILVTNSSGQIPLPDTRLDVAVASSINPTTNETFSTKPSCSISSVVMNLNETYSFTCGNVVQNLDITPLYNEYFVGSSVDVASGIYTYNFKPVKFGNTDFIATFTFKGAPIFTPYRQEVKIQSSGAGVPGTDLKLLFTPELNQARDGEQVIIQLVDNKTSSLVFNPEIYINAVLLESVGNSFFYEFDANKNYSIRGRADGYNDLTDTIALTSKPISIFVNPESGNTQTIFEINTSTDNATLYINDIEVENPFSGNLVKGENEIRASKEGFLDSYKNLTVDQATVVTGIGEFKSGVLQTFTVTNNASWKVYYRKNPNTEKELLLSGNSEVIEFTPNNAGTYTIEDEDGNILLSRTLEGFNFNAKWGFLPWWVWIIGLILVIGIILGVKRNNVPQTDEAKFMVGESASNT